MTRLRQMRRQVIDTWDEFFSSPWRVIPFQPILYFFLWGAAVRLWANQSAPPNFDEVIAHGFYGVWLSMGIVGPVLALVSWYLIRKRTGRWRFLGMWARLAADITVSVVILAFHVVNVSTRSPTESRIFSRYLLGASLLFVLILIVRDLAALVLTERLAGRIHRGDNE